MINCFLIFLLFPVFYGFLLEPSASNAQGISDKHFTTLMDLLVEERKARQRLEESVTQIYGELVNKTAGPSKTCQLCQGEVIKLKQMISSLERNLEQVVNKNLHLSGKFDNVSDRLRIIENQSSEYHSKLNAFMKVSANNSSLDLSFLKTDSENLRNQVNTLTLKQFAREQDFLALFNQTLSVKSELSAISHYHNRSMEQLLKTVHNEVNTTYEKVREILNVEMHYLQERVKNESFAQGTTYIRWETTDCPTDTELVYTGYVVTERDKHASKIGTPVCLPFELEFTSNSTFQDRFGFEGRLFTIVDLQSNGSRIHVACSVCRTIQATSVVMIPGKATCSSGWKMEYYGYLGTFMSSDDNTPTPIVCVDASANPETLTWPAFLETMLMGSKMPLTCVVCSK